MDDGKIALDGTPKEVFTQVVPLRDMGLTVPDTVDLLDRLRKDGLEVPLDALTVEECAAAITAALTKKLTEELGLEPIIQVKNLTHTYGAGSPFPAQRRGSYEL